MRNLIKVKIMFYCLKENKLIFIDDDYKILNYFEKPRAKIFENKKK